MEELDRLLESVWERGSRDTKAALHSLWFWVIEVFGGGAVALVWGGGFALIFVFAVKLYGAPKFLTVIYPFHS